MPDDAAKPVVAIVDPISTGASLAKFLSDKGYPLVRVFSDTLPDEVKALVAEGLEVDWRVTIQHEGPGRAAYTAAALRGVGVTEVIVGSEPGVSLQAELSSAFGDSPVPVDKIELRRNKYLQSEAVRDAGFDAVHQTLAHTREDVEEFIGTVERSGAAAFKAVVKPVEGAGSDGVSICNSAEEVRAAFGRLEGTKNILGLENYAVLCQEFLAGDEYVVDSVSRGGVHKVVALWRYDKRDYYGSPVVYHGMQLLNVESDPTLLSAMVDYVTSVLNALGVTDGAMHTEVMNTPRGPVLVEVNCRLHGGEGIWLPIAQACLHYTQVSALHDAHFAPNDFAALPATPLCPMLQHGAWVTIRSPSDGTVTAIHHERLEQIRGLRSFLGEYFAPCISAGSRVRQTVDATTVHGCFNLAHEERAVLEADYAVAQQLINDGLFSVAPPKPDEEGVVRVETPSGIIKVSYSFSEEELLQNSLWGRLSQMWKPLDAAVDQPVPVAKLREVRRGWRF